MRAARRRRHMPRFWRRYYAVYASRQSRTEAARFRKSFMPNSLSRYLIVWFVVVCASITHAQSATPSSHPQVKTLKVTILSTMLADEGSGEWGFAALVESDGHRILV